MNEHQEKAIFALENLRDDSLSKIEPMLEGREDIHKMLMEFKADIDSTIEWVKRQTGE